MGTSKTIAKNFIYTTFYKVLRIILPLVTVPYVTRVLGAEKLGIYDYTYSIVTYFQMFAYLGFENYGSRLIAENNRDKSQLNKAFSAAYYFQVCSSVLALAAYAIYVAAFCKENVEIAWIQSLYIVAELFNISWMYFGLEKFKITSTVNIAARLLSFAGIFIFVRTKNDLILYSIFCAGTLLFSSLILWVGAFKHIKFVYATPKEIWEYGKGSIVLFFPVLVINIYRTMDKIMLGNIVGMAEVAIYSNADKIVEVPYMILASLGVVTLPKMTNFAQDGEIEKTKYYIEKSMRVIMFMACGMAFGMMGVGKTFAPIFFGEEFLASGVLIMVIAPHVIFRGNANVVRNQYLLPKKRDKDYIISILIGVVINLVFNSIFIPLWGAVGAAYATLLAESFVALYQIFICRKEIPVVRYTVSNLFFILAGFLMFIPVYLYGESHVADVSTLLIQVAMGVMIYLVVAGSYFWLKEKKLILSFIKHRAQ
ncbi:MAG: flippase [Marvinbryantia sp.]|uniref:flippase n=1 Tax=Marvinbryantia sp. TaxID=2496532 RepID=UPI002666C8A7|nr:flippase [uncultured Marvinbryantia sp.]